jgi:hypothetical protein
MPVAGGELSFAGLSPRTTVEAAKKRYARSSFLDRHVSISEEDSHDHTCGLDLANSGDACVRIWLHAVSVNITSIRVASRWPQS